MRLRTLENRLHGGLRDSSSGDVPTREPRPWSVASLAGQKYCLLTSYRSDGRPVSTPVWFGVEGERLYVRSGDQDGKVKRIRRNGDVLVTACAARGRPLGDPMQGVARILSPHEHDRAEAVLRARYGLGRKLYRLARRRLDAAYLEISPARRLTRQ